MGKFKRWEILLCVTVVLLGAIAYEAHKTNSQSRYTMVGSPWELLDTRTGNFWSRIYPIDSILGNDTSYVYEWRIFNHGPETSSGPDTVLARRSR